jgi:hypothetical protein
VRVPPPSIPPGGALLDWVRGAPAAFAVIVLARHPETVDEASTGRSLIVAARTLAHPVKRGFVGGLHRRDFPHRRHPSYAASIFCRFGTFTLWVHGNLQASHNYFCRQKRIEGKTMETFGADRR